MTTQVRVSIATTAGAIAIERIAPLGLRKALVSGEAFPPGLQDWVAARGVQAAREEQAHGHEAQQQHAHVHPPHRRRRQRGVR